MNKTETRVYALSLGLTFLMLVLSVILFFLPGRSIGIPLLLSHGLSFTVDGFRKIYALVISFMWFMTMLLSKEYFAGHHHNIRYFVFNILTEGAILGVFFSSDLFTALVFFEIMSFTSFVWVIQEETEGAVRAAGTYLAIAVIGGLSALMGIWLLEKCLGTTEIARLYEAAQAYREGNSPALLYTAGALILAGFGAKAGVFPLHIWLPKAHPVAPAPASALLSGVLTKSGVFGVIAVSCGIFREDPAWGAAILILGTVTMLLGAVLALLSIDLKRTLACSSMSQIGFIMIGIACTCLLGEEGGLSAAGTMLHMVNHSLLKLNLFMCAGVIYMNLHELDLNLLRGFGRGKHLLQAAFLLGALGIGGIPGFNGYISKTLLHEGIVEASGMYGRLLSGVEWIFLLSGGLTIAYMTKLYVCIFHEKPGKEAEEFQKERSAHRPKYIGWAAGAALAVSALILPLFGLTGNRLMLRIAGLSSGFFRAKMPEALRFFSLENLKGAGISALIGTAVYLLVVRKVLMKDGRYVNRLPRWADLEEIVYRPLLLRILPAVFGWIAAVFGENKILTAAGKGVMKLASFAARLFGENRLLSPLSKGILRLVKIFTRAASDAVDAVILLLAGTVFRPVLPPSTEQAEHSIFYRLGNSVDRIYRRRGKEAENEHRFARLFYRIRETMRRTTHNLTDSMSFALLATILAVTAILLYVLFVHHFG